MPSSAPGSVLRQGWRRSLRLSVLPAVGVVLLAPGWPASVSAQSASPEPVQPAAAAAQAPQPAADQPAAQPAQPAVAQPVAQPVKPAQPAVPAGPALSSKEKALLEKIRALKAPRWRSYGACRYDWTLWRLAGEGVRTTAVQCGKAEATETVAVHCETFKISYRLGEQPWSTWRLPFSTEESSSRGGEDLMVAALCANAQPVPRPEPAAATPAAQSAAPVKGAGAGPKPTRTAAPAAAR